MPKTALEQWDETAGNNTDIDSINIDEGCAPSGMNNAARATMAQIAKWIGDDTLASAATTDLGSVPGRYINITGTTSITAFGTIKAGTIKYLKFAGALTLTHNATSLILPGAANITTTAGDTAVFVSEGSGNWRCINYLPSAPVINTANGQYKFPAVANLSADANTLDDYEEGTHTPNVTASSGTITSVSGSTGVYQKVGKYVHFKSVVTITDAGTGSGFLQIALPYTPDGSYSAYGRETAVTGKQLQGQINSGSAIVSVAFYDNTWPGATGNTIVIQGTYTTASA